MYVAGTLRYAELKPNLPASMFPAAQPSTEEQRPESSISLGVKRTMNISRQRSKTKHASPPEAVERVNLTDEDLLDDIDDIDMIHAADDVNFRDVEEYSNTPPLRSHQAAQRSFSSTQDRQSKAKQDWEPTRFGNGRWACNHKCKDKNKSEGILRGVDRMPLTTLQV